MIMCFNQTYIYIYIYIFYVKCLGECLHGVVDNVLDCYILANEFEFQSRYNYSFRPNTFGKGTKNDLTSTFTVFQ